MVPNFQEEIKLWKRGYKRVVGIDEAGCGPLAGPVVAAAVVINSKLPPSPFRRQSYGASATRLRRASKTQNSKLQPKPQNFFKEIRDSKKLTPKKREELYKLLIKNPAIEWAIGIVSEKIIDKINIRNAAELAMEKAISKLKKKPNFLIIDGKHLKNPKLKKTFHKLFVKADENIFSCAAASIIAKVTRDRIMKKHHRAFPKYRFDKHKGYGTELHLKMLKKFGPCRIHRKSFAPVIQCKMTNQNAKILAI